MQFTYPNHSPQGFHGFRLMGSNESGRWYPSEGGVTVDKVWAARALALRAVTDAVRAVEGVLVVDARMSQGSIMAHENLHLIVHFKPGARRVRKPVEAAIRRALSSLGA